MAEGWVDVVQAGRNRGIQGTDLRTQSIDRTGSGSA